jgi:catechol 2,3-dioxygenase-like lactoylglutathione lyase family enzyme
MIAGARYTHTNLIAHNWRRLAVFYESVFACVPVPPERNYSGPELEALTALPGASLTGVHLLLPGSEPGGPTLEIFEYASGVPDSTRAVNRPGLAHLAFSVDSVADALAEVVAAGGAPVGEVAVLTTSTGSRVTAAYATDPEGNVVELLSWE